MSEESTQRVRASFVIPTRNAGPLFAELLDRAGDSLPGGELEIIVIDSGSSDDTVAVAKSRGAQLHEIPTEQFGHGRTRNLGVSLARGEFVVFLSQDALPRDRDWLMTLLDAFEDERMAGAYCRVVAGGLASPLVARSTRADLTGREQAIDQRIDDVDAWPELAPHTRRIASHFNNVASCVRRSVALEFPFPELEFGEDVAWAQAVMLEGYTVGYRPASVVVHAHGSGIARDYHRYRCDSALHHELFGEDITAWQCLRTCAAEIARDLRAIAAGGRLGDARYGFYSPVLRAAQATGRWVGFHSRTSSRPEPVTRIRRRLIPVKIEASRLQELFDAEFYLGQLSDDERAIGDPFRHYLEHGDELGYWPHPLFDPDYYSEQRPTIPRRGGARLSHYCASGSVEKINPHRLFDALWYSTQDGCLVDKGDVELAHYLRTGDAENRWPHPLFDPLYYGGQHPHLGTSGGERLIDFAGSRVRDRKTPHELLDPEWMLSAHPGIESSALDLVSFYVTCGEDSGLRPNPFFDPAWYRANHPDLADWKLLLYHYAHHGTKERRQPCALFDAPWYQDRHPEVAESGLHPIVHYRDHGDALDYWPNSLFDPIHYGSQQGDVEAAGGARLLHYEATWRTNFADPHPLFSSRWVLEHGVDDADDDRPPIVRYREKGEANGVWPHPLFDSSYYADQVAELSSTGPCLLAHYYFVGAREGFDPNPLFDGTWYLEQHPELRVDDALICNPLVHYVEAQRDGSKTTCNPHPLFDAHWYREQVAEVREQQIDPLQHFLHVGSKRDENPHPRFDSKYYRTAHGLDDDQTPIIHYLTHRDATGAFLEPFFNEDYYKATCAKTRLAQISRAKSVFADYLERGYNRGYAPGPVFEFCRKFFINDDPALCDPAINPLAGALEGVWGLTAQERHEVPIAFEFHEAPQVSIIVAAHGPVPYTLACLRALASARGDVSFEVILVVDGPVKHSTDPFAEIGNITLLRNEVAQGFLHASNAGAGFARGERLVFLNNDALPQDGWLDALVDTTREFPNAGIVASRLLQPSGRLQEAGSIVFDDGSAANYGYGEDPDAPQFSFAREVDYASAAALMIDRSLFDSLGGFDDRYAPAFYEDTDLAFRVREAGLEVVCQPASTVVHFGGVNYTRDSRTDRNPHQDANRKTFIDRWAEVLPEFESSDVPASRAVLRGARGHVLVLDTTTPTPLRDSGSLRMFNMLRVLRRMKYRVTFVPVDLGCPAREIDRMRAAGIEVYTSPDIHSVAEFLEEHGGRFDLCLLSRPRTAGRTLAAVKSSCPAATVVYDTVDLHFLRRARQIDLLGESDVTEADAMRESLACSSADRVVVVSEFDRLRLSEEVPEAKIHIVSNVHDEIAEDARFEGRSGLLFIGGFRHAPNVDAMLWFAEQVMPLVVAERPEAVLHIVGSEMPDEVTALASESIVVHGYVEDPTPLFQTCLLSVAPLRYGSGVKGKVNQSMSHGLPCVATSVAAEGLEVEHGRELLIADDAEAFAREVLRLHDDRECWNRLSRASLTNVATHFSMQAAESRLTELLEACGLEVQLTKESTVRTASP